MCVSLAVSTRVCVCENVREWKWGKMGKHLLKTLHSTHESTLVRPVGRHRKPEALSKRLLKHPLMISSGRPTCRRILEKMLKTIKVV